MRNLNAMIVTALAATLAVPSAEAAFTAPAVPVPPVITYGLVRSELGEPLADGAGALARLVKADGGAQDERVYAQGVIAANVYRGMNYLLSQEIDSKGPVRSRAVTVGTPMRVKVLVNGGEQPLLPSPTWTTPGAGTLQRKDYTIGEDSDGDGMPDSWELWMMALYLDYDALNRSDAELLASFDADGDADGDGISNLAEFQAGTNPFLKTDLFGISSFECVPGLAAAALSFSTVRGRQYHVLIYDADADTWSPVATTDDPNGAFAFAVYDGNGGTLTVYVDAALSSNFFKVACY